MGLLHRNEGIVARNRLETKAFRRDKNRLVRAVVDAIGDLLKARKITRLQVAGAGMGLPGPVDTSSGVVKYLPNIPGWKNVPLARQLREQLQLPVFIDNDVNLITLGEWKYGAGQGYANLFCVTLGTGVGSGLIIDGNLYRGEGFVAGEIGHAVMRDDFPSRSFADGYAYVEHYAGNGALLEKARQMISPGLTCLEDIYPLVRKKDRKALKFYDHTGRFLGNVLVGVINLLNPRLVIIGGGVSNHYPYFKKSLKATVHERAMTVHRRMVKITRACLGDDAGLYGADILVRQSLREERA